MDFTLNELSLVKLNSKAETINVFIQLSDVTSALSSMGFNAMKIWNKSQFMNFDFCNGFTMIYWFKHHKYSNDAEKNRSQILKSIITKKDSEWSEEESSLIENIPIIGIQHQNIQGISEGLKIACLYNTIAVSFNTDRFWDKSTLDLIYIAEDENQNTFEQIVSVNHAATTSNIDTHKEWLNYLLSKKLIGSDWIPSENYFPHLTFSNQLMVNEDWNMFYKRRDEATTPSEKRAIIIEIGKKVAERNSYTFDKKVSELNSSRNIKRIVFGAGMGKNRIYLSIDLEKGGFEVCNYLGEHQGEYFFDGSMTSDRKHGHDLTVKS